MSPEDEAVNARLAGVLRRLDGSCEQLQELLETCGKRDEEDFISFELFARSVALLLEENADKISTSSQ